MGFSASLSWVLAAETPTTRNVADCVHQTIYCAGRKTAHDVPDRLAPALRGPAAPGTNAPLATIARQVGYSTEFAFGAAFRREYGIASGRFRDLESRQARSAQGKAAGNRS
ncbi:hypothetical protein GCM10023080_030680 [Streptomyces pseudoechinosporeus]